MQQTKTSADCMSSDYFHRQPSLKFCRSGDGKILDNLFEFATHLTNVPGARYGSPSLILKPILVLSSLQIISVADPDPRFGAFLTPGFGIRKRFFPNPGSRIPNPKPYFRKLFDNFWIFWVKSTVILNESAQFFLHLFKNKIICGNKKRKDNKFFPPSL